MSRNQTDELNTVPDIIAYLFVLALGFGLGYGVRERKSRQRRRRHIERSSI